MRLKSSALQGRNGAPLGASPWDVTFNLVFQHTLAPPFLESNDQERLKDPLDIIPQGPFGLIDEVANPGSVLD